MSITFGTIATMHLVHIIVCEFFHDDKVIELVEENKNLLADVKLHYCKKNVG